MRVVHRELEGLTRAQRKALSLVLEYLRETGRRCFTYNSLARHWSRSSVRMNANTLERRIRELVEEGILERLVYTDERGRRRTSFCLKRDLYHRFVETFLLIDRRVAEEVPVD